MKLANNIGRSERQKLGLATIVAGCFLVSLALLAVSKPYDANSSSLNFWMRSAATTTFKAEVAHSSLNLGTENATPDKEPIHKLVTVSSEKNSEVKRSETSSAARLASILELQDDQTGETLKIQERKPVCDFSDPRSDVCEMDGEIRMNGNSSTILYLTSSQPNSQENDSWKIKPHARKGDPIVLSHVTEISVAPTTNLKLAPHCSINHSVPAIVFSTGGYMGNMFHDFTDVLIPLFITSRQYKGEVQFLVSDILPLWLKKYSPLLNQLSTYDIVDFNRDQRVHCYPHAIVGLRSHREMTIEPSRAPNGYSMYNFCELMRSSFGLERENAVRLGPGQTKKPRLLIVARKYTRSFKNVDEIANMARWLGFEVEVAEPVWGTNMTQFFRKVNSCDVMMGVHGAGLTNFVVLPTNAILIQVVPLGRLEGISWLDFGRSSMDAKMRYLEYRISEDESTLIEQYPRDHPVLKDPKSIHKQGWLAVRKEYLVKQNVRIDVDKFKYVLLQAIELLKV